MTELVRSLRNRDPMKGLTADEIIKPCLQCASMLFQKVLFSSLKVYQS